MTASEALDVPSRLSSRRVEARLHGHVSPQRHATGFEFRPEIPCEHPYR